MLNNKNLIRLMYSFYCSKSKAAARFGCVKQPISGRMYQKMYKENYKAVAIPMTIKSVARSRPYSG